MKNDSNQNAMQRRWLWIMVAFTILIFGFTAFVLMPAKNEYTVSPETTMAIGPLDVDGYVDNLAVINERLRGNITPERNANVIIWQALGLGPERVKMPSKYFELLGSPSPREDGDYFISWKKFIEMRQPERPSESPSNIADIFEEPDGKNATDLPNRLRKWPWKAAEAGEFVACLNRNERSFELFKQASKMPEYYNPLAVSRTTPNAQWLMHCNLANTFDCQHVAELICARAMLRLGEGRTQEAWADLMTCHRLGRLMQRGGSLVEQLSGFAIETFALHGEQIFLSQARLTRQILDDCREDLRKLPFMPSIADHVDLTERFAMLDLIQQFARTGPDFIKALGLDSQEDFPLSRMSFIARSTDWNSAMKLANAWCDRIVATLKIEDLPSRLEAMTAIDSELKELLNDAKQQAFTAPLLGPQKRGDLFGKIVVGLSMTTVAKFWKAEESLRQRNDNLLVAFALESYRLDKGRYPKKLSDLSPGYFQKIPNDRYTAKSLIYVPKEVGYQLYSVGPNQKDEQGRFRVSSPTEEDISIEMPATEPPAVSN